ncbi:LPS-assembly protein LptD [Devriesea agamarum]|uniref:hypothetical protein n=1 Tax=Devriesea agamarum TaxID=472569 RepID=UPI00071CF355|nr:hypothetical protein [Devriesea agamarum]
MGDTTNIKRRAFAKGAAWTVPVAALTSTAPAYAASASGVSGCYTLDWSSSKIVSGKQGYDARRSVMLRSDAAGKPDVEMYVSQERIVGTPDSMTKDGTVGDFSIGFNAGWDSIGGVAIRLTGSPGEPSQPNGKGLVLAQQRPAGGPENNLMPKQTVTFKFPKTPKSITYTVFDFDRGGEGSYGRWIDKITLSDPASNFKGYSRYTSPLSATSGTELTPAYGVRPNDGSNYAAVTVTHDSPLSSSTYLFTYENVAPIGNTRQYWYLDDPKGYYLQEIAVGDFKVCF